VEQFELLAQMQGRVSFRAPWVWVGQRMAYVGRLGVAHVLAYARGWVAYVDELVDVYRTMCLSRFELWGYACGDAAQRSWLSGF
jgi:hypothetical protein